MPPTCAVPGRCLVTTGAAAVAVVVVNYRSHAYLESNVAALGAALPTATVVVVDSFSDAAERSAVERITGERGWELVAPPDNVGFGRGMNSGVRHALDLGSEVVLMLNPDVTIAAGTVVALAEMARAAPLTLLTPRLERPDGTVWFAGGQIDLRRGLTRSRPDHEQVGDGRWLTGACLVVHRRLWELVGGFDPEYFMYWEDIDLSFRCLEAGGDLRVAHELVAVHDVGGTQAGGGKSPLYAYYNCRNRLLFARRHLGWRARARWALLAPAYLRRVVLRSGKRHLARHPMVVIRALSGTAVGLIRSVGRD